MEELQGIIPGVSFLMREQQQSSQLQLWLCRWRFDDSDALLARDHALRLTKFAIAFSAPEKISNDHHRTRIP